MDSGDTQQQQVVAFCVSRPLLWHFHMLSISTQVSPHNWVTSQALHVSGFVVVADLPRLLVSLASIPFLSPGLFAAHLSSCAILTCLHITSHSRSAESVALKRVCTVVVGNSYLAVVSIVVCVARPDKSQSIFRPASAYRRDTLIRDSKLLFCSSCQQLAAELHCSTIEGACARAINALLRAYLSVLGALRELVYAVSLGTALLACDVCSICTA